ncbi:ABC transporter substrate-binding protein [Hyalangium rubrum]|uniref:ABC transporter substrate-binding protein n=1 Tax=Hyalangium rubrum TaxID=3103134 RepID=A0ABU5HBA0_9BACT|nr:ABC transporter substrate-binding protein [Hyalangium sp. s54d21]MDY7229390.1 ABC transporter substrate-binding protein [Hyalangium sp. s54d21]
MQRHGRTRLALLALALAACSSAPQPPLVVGTVPWVGTEPLFLARELGLYPAGQIHLAEYMNTPQRLQAFRNGVIDAVTLTLDDVMILDHFGQEVRVVLVLDASHGADCLMARREVKSLADLKGLRVASEDMTLPTYMLHRALEEVKLRGEDVQRVFHNPEEQETVFQRGTVDAVVSYEPYCTRLEAAGAHRLFDSARIPGEIIDVLVVRESHLRTRPEQVDMLLRGWFAALARFQAAPSESARRMAPRLGLEAPWFLESMAGVRHPSAREQHALLAGEEPRLVETIDRVGAVMVQQQLLPTAPSARRLLDSGPLLRVAP